MRQLNAKSVTCKMRKVGGAEPVVEFLVKDRYEKASHAYCSNTRGKKEVEEKEREK